MADEFEAHATGLDSPGRHVEAVTPNDAADLPTASRGLYVGTSGNIKMTFVGGETEIFYNVPVGDHPYSVTRIWDTGTTADNMIAMW